ncbi:MAG: ABC transporter ATP-binding protein [Clostridia bacterium]|nr:ABC transporter ATP-binding protein [Clostridia bacterium]
MRRVIGYLREFAGRMTVGFIIKTLGTIVELFLPLILSHILKNVIGRSMKDILLWGALMIVCSAAACILNVVANRMAAKVSKCFAENLRRDLFIKTLRLSAAQTDSFTIPSLESRITSDTYNVHGFINMIQRLGVRAPILLIGGVGMTLIMDARLATVMIALLPLIFVTVFFIRMKGIPLYAKVQRSVDSMIRVVREDSQGIRVIKALSKSDYEHRRYDKVNCDLVHDETKAGVIMGCVNPIMTAFMNLGSVGVIALGAFLVSKDVSDPETVIAFMQYFTLISMAMMSVTRMFVMYTKCSASASRIAEVLESSEDLPVFEEDSLPNKDTDAHILFDSVSFSYSGKKNNVDNISFSVKQGGSLGVIGATGSGKSTLIKLLLRFYDTDEGAIYVNGKDIRTIDKKSFYAMFGTVLQHDFLYADTIIENIRFGRDVSDEDIRRVTKIAQADGFIENFEEGYDRVLSQHGTNISGGQKQRTLISRALAAKPPILILDDSSSALDYKTDAALRKALAENMRDTTIITVAQRVSSVKDCDTVIVMDEGRIIGMGTHEQLLETCPEYKEISDSQMGGAFVE